MGDGGVGDGGGGAGFSFRGGGHGGAQVSRITIDHPRVREAAIMVQVADPAGDDAADYGDVGGSHMSTGALCADGDARAVSGTRQPG